MQDYRTKVVQYLLDGYERGLTPNPDVMCNREIKFGVFRAWAAEHGFSSVATGHYARRHVAADGMVELVEAADRQDGKGRRFHGRARTTNVRRVHDENASRVMRLFAALSPAVSPLARGTPA